MTDNSNVSNDPEETTQIEMNSDKREPDETTVLNADTDDTTVLDADIDETAKIETNSDEPEVDETTVMGTSADAPDASDAPTQQLSDSPVDPGPTPEQPPLEDRYASTDTSGISRSDGSETQSAPEDEAGAPASQIDEAKANETETDGELDDSDLPEPDFDPATTPSAYDPRVTGEVEADTDALASPFTAPADGANTAEASQYPGSEHPGWHYPPAAGHANGQHYSAQNPTGQEQTNNPFRPAPGQNNPFQPFAQQNQPFAQPSAPQQPGPQPGHQPNQPPNPQPNQRPNQSQHPAPGSSSDNPLEGVNEPSPLPYAYRPSDDGHHPVKFGLLTWALVLVFIGVMVIAVPWWYLINWPVLGTSALALMGVIMLVTAVLASRKERKSKKR